MNEEKNVVKPEKKKKKRSFWWLWLLLILVVFAGGVILGLKLNTMPEPYAIVSRYFPSLVPSQSSETGVAVAATPEPTPVPTEAPAPAVTEAPVEETAAAAEQPAEPEETPDAALPVEEAEEEEDLQPAPEETDEPKAEGRPVFGKKNETEKEDAAPAEARAIGIDRAFEAALEHAGFEKDEVELSGVFKTDDAGTTVYQVEFTADGRDYEYRINAETAEVEGWRSTRQSTRAIEEYYPEAPEVEPELFPSPHHA